MSSDPYEQARRQRDQAIQRQNSQQPTQAEIHQQNRELIKKYSDDEQTILFYQNLEAILDRFYQEAILGHPLFPNVQPFRKSSSWIYLIESNDGLLRSDTYAPRTFHSKYLSKVSWEVVLRIYEEVWDGPDNPGSPQRILHTEALTIELKPNQPLRVVHNDTHGNTNSNQEVDIVEVLTRVLYQTPSPDAVSINSPKKGFFKRLFGG